MAALLMVAGPAASDPATYYTEESWVDSRYGWRKNGGTVESTENGGLTWHRILRAYAFTLARTSRTTGVVGVRGRVLWTRDNGRHWRRARIGRRFQGQHQWLFYVDRPARRLFQVTPWPPQGRLKTAVVAELPAGQNFSNQLESIPGGIAAAIDRHHAPGRPGPQVLIRRHGRNRVLTLPRPDRWPHGSCYLTGFRVKWPVITVLAQIHEGYGYCDSSISAAIIWWSPDGGDSWVIGAPTDPNA